MIQVTLKTIHVCNQVIQRNIAVELFIQPIECRGPFSWTLLAVIHLRAAELSPAGSRHFPDAPMLPMTPQVSTVPNVDSAAAL